jgi:hypothetical protein
VTATGTMAATATDTATVIDTVIGFEIATTTAT